MPRKPKLSIGPTSGTREVPASSLGVIGPSDERQKAQSTAEFDFRMIARVKAQFAGISDVPSTGFLIGKKWVLTCAHGVTIRLTGGRLEIAREVRCALGANGAGNYPDGDLLCAKVLVAPNHSSSFGPEHDYALLELPVALGEQLGNFGAGLANEIGIGGRVFTVAGYPREEPAAGSRGPIRRDTLWFAKGQIELDLGAFLNFQMDTSAGQSGGPIYTPLQSGDGSQRFVAAGINIGGFAADRNLGLRFRQDIFDQLKAWMK